MRTCCQCGRPDQPIPTPDVDGRGEPIVYHSVVPDVREIKSTEELTPRLMRQGFRHRAPFQGKQVIERFICRECLNENDLRDRVWGEMRADAKRMEKKVSSDEEYYAVLNEA